MIVSIYLKILLNSPLHRLTKATKQTLLTVSQHTQGVPAPLLHASYPPPVSALCHQIRKKKTEGGKKSLDVGFGAAEMKSQSS